MCMWILWCLKTKTKQMEMKCPKCLANRIYFKWQERKRGENTQAYSHISCSSLWYVHGNSKKYLQG